MRILIVGSNDIFAIENFFVKYLSEDGVSVRLFNAQSIFSDFYQNNLFNKILFRSGFSSIHKKINREFRKAVLIHKPDVIWVFKGMELTPESLLWSKGLGIKLVNFNPDNPFVFSGPGSGNQNVTNSIFLYDLHLTYNTSVKEQFEKHKANVSLLPFGFDLDQKVFDECVKQKEIIKLCFLGNPDTARASFLQQLAIEGISIDVYGNGWKKYLGHQNITIFDPVIKIDFWKTLRKYRIQLNLMRLHNPTSHNMRSFETPGVGGIMLAPDTPEHRIFFQSDKEIFLFNDIKSCLDRINFLLSLSEAEADNIREAARCKSIEAGYTYKDRSRQALVEIKKLLNSNEQ